MNSAMFLNLAAFSLTVAGSGLGMWGALMQANAYYPFGISKFATHILRVFWKALWKGTAPALEEIHVTTKLGEKRGEKRERSLVGLYLVFCGFLLNLVGAALAFAATLVDAAAKAHG